eukprot:UN05111
MKLSHVSSHIPHILLWVIQIMQSQLIVMNFVLYRATTTEESGIIPIELKSTFPNVSDANPGFVYYHGKSGTAQDLQIHN